MRAVNVLSRLGFGLAPDSISDVVRVSVVLAGWVIFQTPGGGAEDRLASLLLLLFGFCSEKGKREVVTVGFEVADSNCGLV